MPIYLFERFYLLERVNEWEREQEQQAEGEADTLLSREPDVGLETSWDS